MKRTVAALVLALVMFVPDVSEAQKVYRVGVLVATDLFLPAFDGFKNRMEDLGYREDKNIRYVLHNIKGNTDILAAAAGKLAQDRPDLIIAVSDAAAAALANATKDTNIPVVFLSVANPLQFIKSYASSGNNFAGISASTIDLTQKRVELMTELVPGIRRAISLHHSQGPNYKSNLHATREAGKKFGLNFTEVTVANSTELIERAPILLSRKLGDAIVYPPDPIVIASQKEILPQIVKERLPSVAASIGSVHAGALATYAADYNALGQQGAILGDKIFKGARPRDLPIEQPFKLKLVVNLKTAKAIRLKVPKEILIRTDEIVE